MDDVARSYDQVPYENVVYATLHPARMAGIARLHGLAAPPVATARVLELGCAAGWNLLAMGRELPAARFVGIDIAPSHIADGQALAGRLGLDNVTLIAGDATSLALAPGPFDYIIAHGLYSWVPDDVRERLLSSIAARLAPDGLAYVSFNARPGFASRHALRDMMLYHTRHLGQPRARVAAARELMGFLAEAVSPKLEAYRQRLADEVAFLAEAPDDYVFHDHLEANNAAIYLFEMAERARAAGLTVLAEARMQALLPPGIEASVQALAAGDEERAGVYRDFVVNRAFHRALLCHPGRGPSPRDARHLATLHVLEVAQRERPEVVHERVRAGLGPAAEALLRRVSQAWPRAVPAAELGDLETLLALAEHGVIEVLAHPLEGARASARPCTWDVARLQIELGKTLVATRHHDALTVPADARALALLADGSRDHEALIDAFADAAAGVTTPDDAPTEWWWRGRLAAPTPDIEGQRERDAARVRHGLGLLEQLGLLAS